MRVFIWILISVILFVQCKKQEIPIEKRGSGDLITQSIDMNEDYKYQIFFDLETNAMTGANVKTDWDVAFNCNVFTPSISLNSSKYMGVWNTGSINFADVPDLQLAEWKYDSPESNTVNTAFGEQWKIQSAQVYVVDRGYGIGTTGSLLEHFKCTVTLLSDGNFEFRTADLNGDNETIIIIQPDANRNRVVFSYDTKSIVTFEPQKDDWDLLFSQYTHIYPDSMTYLVNGVLINSFETEVASDSILNFSDITISDTSNLKFTNQLDEIGFDWKYYNLGASSFIILPDKNYLIKTSESRVFKLRFIDFFDGNGIKGTPTFEFQEL